MSLPKWIVAGIIFSLVLLPLKGRCAESSADVSASQQLKESALKEVLGKEKKDVSSQDEYVIGDGDLISVSIYGEGDMAAAPVAAGNTGGSAENTAGAQGAKQAGAIAVRMDGEISLKHIGDVKAAGLTLAQLADYLKKLYAQIYDDPVVTTVLVRTNRRYSVMGKVVKPGVYPLASTITLVQAIASCGGFAEWADRDVSIIRKDVHDKDKGMFKDHVLDFDYDDFLKGEDMQKNIPIQADDVIVAH